MVILEPQPLAMGQVATVPHMRHGIAANEATTIILEDVLEANALEDTCVPPDLRWAALCVEMHTRAMKELCSACRQWPVEVNRNLCWPWGCPGRGRLPTLHEYVYLYYQTDRLSLGWYINLPQLKIALLDIIVVIICGTTGITDRKRFTEMAAEVFKNADDAVVHKDVFSRIGLSYDHVIRPYFPTQAFRSKAGRRWSRYRAKKHQLREK